MDRCVVQMCGGELFSYGQLERRVLARHPLRPIRLIVNEALADVGPERRLKD